MPEIRSCWRGAGFQPARLWTLFCAAGSSSSKIYAVETWFNHQCTGWVFYQQSQRLVAFKYFLKHVFQRSAGPNGRRFLHDINNMLLKSCLFNILRYEKYTLNNPTTVTKSFPARRDRAVNTSSYCVSLTTEIFLSIPYFIQDLSFIFLWYLLNFIRYKAETFGSPRKHNQITLIDFYYIKDIL